MKPVLKPSRAGVLVGVPVLIVDDDRPSAKLLSIVLAQEGCIVEVASSAEAAVEILKVFRPRVILVDLVLPLMSGLLFAQQLKANPDTHDIVLVAVTAFNGREAERIARDAGIAAYLRKPIDPLSFSHTLVELLGGGA